MFRLFITMTLFLTLTGLASANTINLAFSEIDKSSAGEKSLQNELYSTIETVELEELPLVPYPAPQASGIGDPLGEIIMVVDKLIALGERIWKIVEKGRPVVTTNFQPISVLPKTIDPLGTFYDMEDWRAPLTKRYNLTFKNGFGSKVIDFTFYVIYQYGGSYEGAGKYLTGIQIVPENLGVSWGFKFDAQSTLMTISNRGSKSNPVAAATFLLTCTSSSPLKEIRTSATFHVTGDGQLIAL